MRTISISEFRRITKEQMDTIAPVELTFEGDVIGYFTKKDEVIVIGDLHPRVRTMIRAMEKRARMGMPKTEKLYKDQL